MRLITVLWIIFAGLFFVLAICHWHAALQTMPHFEARPTAGIGKINGVPIRKTGFEKFIPELNSFIDEHNASNRAQNTFAVIGYGLAFLAAVVSAFLTIEGYSDKLNALCVIDVFRRLRRHVPDNKPTGGDVQ